ncbi:MAG TPA: DMT family protein [Bacteroidia bacterium]|nr:DMT family protein [Bacteroidia bacterium]
MKKVIFTILFLILSNTFMTFAWYGHLKFKQMKGFESLPLLAVILISWGIALFEYCFQVPANRIGFIENGGPFTLLQLKVIQEVITLTVFVVFSAVVFKTNLLQLNHIAGFGCLILAVYLLFK